MVPGKGAPLISRKGRTGKVLIVLLALLVLFALYQVYVNGSRWMEEASAHDWQLDPALLILSAALLLLSLSLTPLGWVMISREMGSEVTPLELFAAWYASQLGRYIPGKVWLFAGRTAYLKTKGMGTARAAVTTVWELLFNVASVGLITLAITLLFPDLLPGESLRVAALISGGALLLLPLLHPVQKLVCSRRAGVSREMFPSAGTTVKTVALFCGLWLLRGASLLALLRGAGITGLQMASSFLAAPLSWFAGYIAVMVPGGIGVRETAAALIAAPNSVVPAAVLIAGQRVFMALSEAGLAAWGTSRIRFRGRSCDEAER